MQLRSGIVLARNEKGFHGKLLESTCTKVVLEISEQTFSHEILHDFMGENEGIGGMYGSSTVMVFDTETTGLPNPLNPPYIIQLCFVIFDTNKNAIVKTFQSCIKIPDHVEISSFITNLTGITKQQCQKEGMLMEDALVEFQKEYERCDVIVAHNLSFDQEMIRYEIHRHGTELIKQGKCPLSIQQIFSKSFMCEKQMYCTMQHGRAVCNLWTPSKPRQFGVNTWMNPPPYKKNPKLSELHQHFYGYVPKGLHNALIDAVVCLKCFLKLNT